MNGFSGPHISVAAVIACLLLAGCEKNGASPDSQGLQLQGTLTLSDQGDPSQATVQLCAAPQDAQLTEALTQYPAQGFSPLIPMLYNPLTQNPLAVSTPDANGHFHFENLDPGSYVLDAELEGYGCAQPVPFSLSVSTSSLSLWLSRLQPVAGNLSDTTWASGSAYLLTADVLLLPQATLTIGPGVLVVVGGEYTLSITGNIHINGAPSDPVRFRLSRDHYQSGGDWGGLRLDQPVGTSTISGTSIQGAATALRVTGGNAQVSECLFFAPGAFAGYFSAGATGGVSHSVVLDGDQGLVADNADPTFELNCLLRTSGAAITAKTNSQAILRYNALLDCQTGFWSDWNTAPLIENNLISGGLRGLDAQDGFTGVVQFNVFSGQQQECIYLHVGNCYPDIQNNNFVAAPLTMFHVNGNAGLQADTVFAPYNYWDGEDAAGIPARIIDGHDIGSPDNPIGPVSYLPFRLDPVPNAGP